MRQQGAEIGLRIKLARVARRIRQRELAAILGIPPSVLSDVENDWRCPSEDLISSVCRALHISPEGLREGR